MQSRTQPLEKRVILHADGILPAAVRDCMETGVLGGIFKGLGFLSSHDMHCTPSVINTANEKSNRKPATEADLSHEKSLVNWVLRGVVLLDGCLPAGFQLHPGCCLPLICPDPVPQQ